MIHKVVYCVMFLCFSLVRHGFAQTSNTVRGELLDENKKPVAHANITMDTQQTSSSKEGKFIFQNIVPGQYVLTIHALGYQTYQDTIIKKDHEDLLLQLFLAKKETELKEVLVYGKTEKQLIEEQAIRAIVVDTRVVAEQPVTLAELMNRSPGIRIRQSGGLGNAVDVSINGFQGNSVQYFRDGIPLEYLGGGYGINNVPIRQLERVEVYKGVVPVSLGADALGGAINLVSRRQQGTTVDVSYEIASFNTHIANLSIYHHNPNNNLFAGLNTFYNYSDNNYKADVEVVDGNANPVQVNLPLFHNGYEHYFIEPYIGWFNKSWTDELKLSVAAYHIRRESQHPALMTVSYGATHVYNKGIVPSLRYKKTIGDNFSIDQFVSYSTVDRARIDTVRGTYDWYGNFRPYTDPKAFGETPRPSLSDIDFKSIINRTNLAYRIDDDHKIEGNLVYNQISRLGADPYGLRFNGTDIDVLSKEATYSKIIGGLAWESHWFDKLLTNQLIAKYFRYTATGINGFMANAADLDNFTSFSNHNWGIGNAVKFNLGQHHFIRASFELTNRLPLETELFGDNDTRAPNFQLEPERSFNANLGYRYQNPKIGAEIGTFYRKTQGMILLVPVQPPFAQYQNLDSIQGYGFDVDVHYNLLKNIQLTANATWQDNRMIDIPEGVYQWIEGTRLRNTPYFFANAGLVASFTNVVSTRDRFKPYLHWNFIREFYLNHIPRDKEPKGFLGLFGKANIPLTNVIPDQHLLTAGFNYFTAYAPLSFGFEVKNLANAKLYDYYKIQRPGRSIHFKVNYQLSK